MLQWLDTLIGLTVIFSAVSLVIMILTQIIVAILNLRGVCLKKGIEILLENADVNLKDYADMISAKILNHPLISDKWKRHKSNRWSLATTIRKDELVNILEIISKTADKDLPEKLYESFNKIKEFINNWFDSAMDRVSQSFVRRTRFWTVIFSIIVTFTFHLDVFRLFEQISNDAELRASLIASSNAILSQAEEVVGKSSAIPAVYTEAISQLKLQDKTGAAKELGNPPAFASREEGEDWIRKELKNDDLSDSLVKQYGEIIDTNLTNSVERLTDRANSIIDELNKTKLQVIPQPYPGWDYFPIDKHFWGVLVMAAFLSLGAPFWFNALKILSALRPILATKEDKEKKESKERE
jgi:hypothetical protein